ncbi:hypothetical protein JCM16358_19580 [Halanaerocella petrolearia]
MTKSIKFWFVIIIIVIMIGLQLLLPGFFAQEVKKSLKNEVESWQQLEVDVDAFPAVKVLIGRIDELDLVGRGIKLNGTRVDSLEATFKDLKLKETKEGWQVTEGKNTYLDLEITEEDLNNYLLTKPALKIFKNFKVDLTSSQVIMTGLINFFNAEVNLQLAGNFVVANKDKIVFKSDKLAVENIVVPGEVIKELKNKLQFKIDLAKLTVPIRVRKVNLEQDKLQLLGENGE